MLTDYCAIRFDFTSSFLGLVLPVYSSHGRIEVGVVLLPHVPRVVPHLLESGVQVPSSVSPLHGLDPGPLPGPFPFGPYR